YSNENFFSRDSIGGGTFHYKEPSVKEYIDGYGYTVDFLSNERVKLVKKIIVEDGLVELVLVDERINDSSILSSYFDRLSRQVIPVGAGVIDLFFKEAEAARREYEATQALRREEETAKASALVESLQKKSTLGEIFYGFGALAGNTSRGVAGAVARAGSGLVSGARRLAQDVRTLASIGTFSAGTVGTIATEEVKETGGAIITFVQKSPSPPALLVGPGASLGLRGGAGEVQTSASPATRDETPLPAPPPIFSLLPAAPVPQPPPPPPGFGGGGGAPVPRAEENQNAVAPPSPSPSPPALDTTPPVAPNITSPSDFSATFTNPLITFRGTAEPSARIGTDLSAATTTADGSGTWSLPLSFPQGTTTVQFFASDAANNRSPATTTTLFVDSALPDVTLSIAECTASLVGAGCLLTAPTLSFSWSSSAADVSHFIFSQNNVSTTTAATTTALAGLSDGVYEFSIRAVDRAGNESPAATQRVEIARSPIVINEIAWNGSPASPSDEWIELHNRTGSDIPLDGWTLYADDFSPYLPLSGSIPAQGFYLIERKNSSDSDEATQSPVIGIPADLWTSFGVGLKNSGERLLLVRARAGTATTTVDEVPQCVRWCGYGDDPSRAFSMERISPRRAGTDLENWRSGSVHVRVGTDVSGTPLSATPKRRNAANHLLSTSTSIAANITLLASESPYFADAPFTIQPGVMLSIEPGVTVKFAGGGNITSYGDIVASGRADAPIVFTSIYDDAHGGDLNGDSGATVPQAGDWSRIFLNGASAASRFEYSTFRYGGRYFLGSPEPVGTLLISGFSPSSLSHLVFEFSKTNGINLVHSSSTVSDSAFRDNAVGAAGSYGAVAFGGAPTIEANSFERNGGGMYISDSNARVSGNTFTGNGEAIRYRGGSGGHVAGNGGSGNGKNSILIGGLALDGNATTTLSANVLPYVVDDVSIHFGANAALILEEGVVLKISRERVVVNGHLEVRGSASAPVIVTNISDDSDGTDVVGDGPSMGMLTGDQGIYLELGSTSIVRNAVIRWMRRGLSYTIDSPIDIANVSFENNEVGILAPAGTPIVGATNIIFSNNAATSTIPLP
ncbi:MAG: parallel beta-helix repeat-containing protein, partial [Parcubacteria group bacterium Gr01-1014_72]